jgi:hypothetical protein
MDRQRRGARYPRHQGKRLVRQRALIAVEPRPALAGRESSRGPARSTSPARSDNLPACETLQAEPQHKADVAAVRVRDLARAVCSLRLAEDLPPRRKRSIRLPGDGLRQSGAQPARGAAHLRARDSHRAESDRAASDRGGPGSGSPAGPRRACGRRGAGGARGAGMPAGIDERPAGFRAGTEAVRERSAFGAGRARPPAAARRIRSPWCSVSERRSF